MLIPHSRPSLDQIDIDAVSRVLSSGRLAQAEKVREFENALARYVGKKYGVAVSSGTAALHLALLSLDVGLGDEVIMPSYVCSAPYFATMHARAVPKIVDIDLSNFNIGVGDVEKNISSATKSVIVPHMFGNPADLDALLELGIPIIEDCAQSLGAEYKSRKVGSLGKLSVFSFYATKMITTGEGGMILTDDEESYAKLLELRDYDKKALTPTKYNYKLTDFQASLGISQLSKLPEFVERRRRIASQYNTAFSELEVELPTATRDSKCIYYRYVVMLENMEKVREKVRSDGVICEKPVTKALHSDLGAPECPKSVKAYDHALSIPIYPNLSQEEADYVVARFQKVLGKGNS